jgi:hypothetical protein
VTIARTVAIREFAGLKDLGLPSRLVWYVYRRKDENAQTLDREGQANHLSGIFPVIE